MPYTGPGADQETAALDYAAVDHDHGFWLDRAALMDPAAYETPLGVWTRTVPAGEAWWIVGMGSVDFGSGIRTGYLRAFDARRALMVPAGTTFGSAPGQEAYAHICRPALVAAASHYSNPRQLFLTRLARLKTIPVHEVVLSVDNGSPYGTGDVHTFPTDFDWGMAVHAGVYDAAWITLVGFNMMSEVSNDHPVRFTETLLTPFPRAVMPSVSIRGGNRAGDTTSPTIAGIGSFLYHKLPSDW